MAILANVSAYIACLSAFLFSYNLRTAYIGKEKTSWELVVVSLLSIFSIGTNLIPGLTVTHVHIVNVSDFTLEFGSHGKYFILAFISVISLTFLNIISLRKVTNQLKKTKVNYMFFGMIVFMVSIGVIQGIVALFVNDFSLTWLPPTLSVSEMILTGYAIITSRFYSTRYILHCLTTFLTTSALYVIPFFILTQYLDPSSIYIYLYIPIVGLSWKPTFSYVKKIITLLIYRTDIPPIEQLRSYVDAFKDNPQEAINKISYLLGVPAHQMKIIKNSSDIEFYNPYFEQSSDILILEEVEEKISLSDGENPLINLHQRMTQNNAAMVIPIYDDKNSLSLLLATNHKNNGRLFSREEVKTLKNIIETAQFYIHAHLKIQKYSTLAHSIAHEVRNPLSQIQSHLDLLKYQVEHAFSTEVLTHELDWTMSAIQRGNQLIDMILREVSDSSVQAPLAYLSARDLVTQSVQLFAFEDESYRHRVNIDAAETFTVKTNEVLFNFIIFNLLRNAVYYFESFPQSRIEIKLCCSDKRNYILFKDTGPGIPTAIRKRIFEEFYSYDKPNGSGLGLNYCQRVMETFGGAIECESEYGKYTQFRLSFPKISKNIAISPLHRVDAHHTERPLNVKTKLNTPTCGKLILVVDDLITQRTLLATHLQQMGYRVIQACNGEEAIHLFQTHEVDLVIMDVQMPVMNGIDATKEIKKFNASTPVIAFSGESGEKELDMIEKTMDGRISKPLLRTELQALIEHWLHLSPQPNTSMISEHSFS